jgi:hypothetical protein
VCDLNCVARKQTRAFSVFPLRGKSPADGAKLTELKTSRDNVYIFCFVICKRAHTSLCKRQDGDKGQCPNPSGVDRENLSDRIGSVFISV